jgi:hypothetical protein
MLGKALLSASASASAPAVYYVEDVFSTYLYTGNGSTQTITNDIDLAGEGGLVWIKERTSTSSHILSDTLRGVNKFLQTNLNAAESTADTVTAFNSNGFNAGGSGATGEAGQNYASWTFRKAPRFFDVVTYTGNSSSGRSISHNLGSVPGCIIVKAFDGSGYNWAVYHRGLNGGANPQNYLLFLNATMAEVGSSSAWWGGTAPTSTTFSVGSYQNTNQNGNNYVAYLFAHDAGGFGDAGADNVISCGSVSGFNTVVNLGWEPQWILMKQTNGTSDWILADTMRGIPTGSQDALLFANTSGAETSANNWIDLTSTGFVNKVGSANFIYIAIRRGPMKTPTDATTVFKAFAGYDFINAAPGFPVDMYITRYTPGIYNPNGIVGDRLRGAAQTLFTTSTAAETAQNNTATTFQSNTQFSMNYAGDLAGEYLFRRAPGFFDVVAYTSPGGTPDPQVVNHNLGVAPELIIVKNRSSATNWVVWQSSLGTSNLVLDGNYAAGILTERVVGATSTTFSVGTQGQAGGNAGDRYIAHLFATCPGVSKVGSYTGTGTTLNVDCGFTAGARFVLIKRTDSTGDWYVWDTARGIISGDDPYLLLNSTAAEVTGTDYIDPLSSGFQISSTAPAAINASGGTYIFLAIA